MDENNFLLGEISESLKTMNKELQTLNDILKRIMNNMDRW
jgi:Mg2+ and Co2+ transporter CorA